MPTAQLEGLLNVNADAYLTSLINTESNYPTKRLFFVYQKPKKRL